MKHIVIKNFGPLKSADIFLGRTNLIIGMQSSGKSCVMMIACHCSWVEKRIALRQSATEFMQGTSFIDMLISYYHAKGYVHDDTYIEYQSDYMKFIYDQTTRKFSHEWNSRKRWSYRRPKVSYIPAERNVISIVEKWDKMDVAYNSILDFKTDWDAARKFIKQETDILGTGISYKYDDIASADKITTADGVPLNMVDSSSGVQSLIPQFVHLDYLCKGIYEDEKNRSEKNYSEKQLINNLLEILYYRHFKALDDSQNKPSQIVINKNGRDYIFYSEKDAKAFDREAAHFLNTDHAEVFLEEPESNLFPPTQFQLMNWIVDRTYDRTHRNSFFIATHSPYILNHLLQENLTDFHLFLSYPVGKGCYSIKAASEEEIQQIYDNGSDAFFNFDAFCE